MTDEFIVPSNAIEKILSTLSETRWYGEHLIKSNMDRDDRVTPEVREKRDELYGLLNLNKKDAPPLKIEETDSTIKSGSTDNYKGNVLIHFLILQELVKEVGY